MGPDPISTVYGIDFLKGLFVVLRVQGDETLIFDSDGTTPLAAGGHDMASFAEYDRLDGMGLAQLVRSGEIRAVELCEETIRRAEELNPKLNAIVRPMYDFSRRAAENCSPEAPFCGVPFLLKDVHHAKK